MVKSSNMIKKNWCGASPHCVGIRRGIRILVHILRMRMPTLAATISANVSTAYYDFSLIRIILTILVFLDVFLD